MEMNEKTQKVSIDFSGNINITTTMPSEPKCSCNCGSDNNSEEAEMLVKKFAQKWQDNSAMPAMFVALASVFDRYSLHFERK